MNTVFTEILNMSITASWMILAVVILRFFTRKISKNLNIFMWGLVGLRLLLPFSFKSKISAVPSAETFPTEPVIEKGYSINSGIPVIDIPVNEYIESMPIESATEAAKKTLDTMSIFGIVWVCGFAALVLYGIISCILLRRKVSASMREVNNIYVCDGIKGAFIFGIFKPRIYLPSLLPVWQREYVVYHEKEHLKRHDHIWKPVAFVIACLHWFNPFVWLAYILFCRDIELSCDERVVRKMDKDEKKSYSLALLACSIPHSKLVAAPLAFGEVGVKTRIKSALNYKKPAFWVIVVALIICIGVAVLFMTDPVMTTQNDKDTNVTDIAETNEPDVTDTTESNLTKDEPPINKVELSNEMAEKITQDCFLTLGEAVFDDKSGVVYSEVFYYYTYDGCYTEDRRSISDEAAPYYNSETMSFAVPYEIVDRYLSKRFNTVPDRETVDCYNKETGCYEFERHLGECYYEFETTDITPVDDYTYDFTVKITHGMTDTIPAEYHSFRIRFTIDGYKILKRSIKKADVSEYTETPYPFGLTVEEKIAGYEVYELTPDPVNGIDFNGFVTDNNAVLPSEFAVTFTHIPDFAVIIRDGFNEYNSHCFYIKELYYKNTEVSVDTSLILEHTCDLVYDGNTVCIGNTYYTGHYYLLGPNTYMTLGGDRNKKYDNPLDADTTYKIEYKDGRLEYHACHVCSTVYTAFIDSSLFSYLYKPEDLDHDYSSWGEIKYSEGKWTLIEEGRYTIGERFADELEMRYEDEKKYHEDLRQYETYMDYLEAKEQGLLDKVHYYWDRDRD